MRPREDGDIPASQDGCARGSSLGMQPPHTIPSDVLMLPGAESQMMHMSIGLYLGRSVIVSGRMVLGYKMYVVRP